MRISPQGIRNIIFDLGGVIINIDPELAVQAFEKLGLPRSGYNLLVNEGLFAAIETGECDEAGFYKRFNAQLTAPLEANLIKIAWDALLLDLPKERIDLLLQLKGEYRTFLLSNTNPLHIPGISEQIKKDFGVEGLDGLFEKAWLSYNMGLRKPDPAIFQMVVDAHSLNPAETIFVDDTEEHVRAAQSIGLKAHHLQHGQTINQLFELF